MELLQGVEPPPTSDMTLLSLSLVGHLMEVRIQVSFSWVLWLKVAETGMKVLVEAALSSLPCVCSTAANTSGAQGSAGKDSGAPIHLKGIRGGSVLFNAIEKLRVDVGTELEEVLWALGALTNHTQLLRVRRGADSPTWLKLQDKFKQRVHVPSMSSLRIENLAPEDSGQYFANITSTKGEGIFQVFYLTVYEPVPHPEFLAKSLSITPDLCNVTLECRAPGATEDLNVTWESKGLLRELEQRETPGPAPNPWTLAVNLPLCQCNTHLTCVVSNQVDQKAAILDLRKVCVQGEW
ncbi:SLAM family member 5-like [Pan troglodytes]|uniref:SLAM family member 5-like n=1 Tax=Pan troglodytes TaxID=9598 RepID=UPI0023F035F1|nr:SLAM family member 5-like [Pan troglodytes]